MFGNIKETIKDLSFKAVKIAEETFATGSGQEKKAAAIDYILAMLPVPTIFKSIISILLSKFIDESIEKAVEYMNSIQN